MTTFFVSYAAALLAMGTADNVKLLHFRYFGFLLLRQGGALFQFCISFLGEHGYKSRAIPSLSPVLSPARLHFSMEVEAGGPTVDPAAAPLAPTRLSASSRATYESFWKNRTRTYERLVAKLERYARPGARVAPGRLATQRRKAIEFMKNCWRFRNVRGRVRCAALLE